MPTELDLLITIGFAIAMVSLLVVATRRLTRQHAHAVGAAHRLGSTLHAAFAAHPDRWAVVDDALVVTEIHYPEHDAAVRAAIIGRPVERITPPHMWHDLLCAIDAVRDGAPPVAFNCTMEIEGEPRLFESRVSAIPGGGFVIVGRDVTAIQQVLDELVASEERFRTLADRAPIGVFMTDETGANVYSNAAWCEISGTSHDDNEGDGWADLIHVDDRDRVWEAWQEAFTSGGRFDERFRILTPSGATRWIHSVSAPIVDAGTFRGFLGSAIDITNERTASEAVERSEARLRSIVETTNDAVLIVDFDETIAEANDRAHRLVGVAEGRLRGRRWTDIVARTAHERGTNHEALRAELATTGRVERTELRIARFDGPPIWVLASARLCQGTNPGEGHVVVVFTDVSELKLAEADLRDSEARTRGILENAAEAIISLDEHGHIEATNRAAQQMFAVDPDAARGEPVTSLLDGVPIAHVDARWLEEPSSIHEGITTGRRTDGTTFPIEVSVSSLVVAGRRLVTWIVRDVSSRHAYEAQLEHFARRDALTGLANRRYLHDRLDAAIARARRTNGLVAVLFCDLDRFKVVNDSLGHEVGDRLIVAVAARIQDAVRGTDLLARLGGDEFVVCAEHLTTIGQVADLAGRIAESLDTPFEVDGREIYVTTSIGIALWSGGAETPTDLIRNADTAMYRAKDNGRNRFELFDEAMQTWANARLEYDAALRRAIERDEFVNFYQPLTDLRSGATLKLEALVRWEREGLGFVSPSEFVPLAEETGLVVALGAFVLDQACRDCAAWQDIAPEVGVTVNVSARQLGPELITTVANALRRRHLRPELLTLEITESLLMDDVPRALELLHELRALGVSLALDDFGTGYSSLTYLRELPIQFLKIDQSFVRGIDDAGASLIVESIIALAHALRLGVVAEGVEREDQRASLTQLGCDLGQGFIWARPMPIADANRYLVAQRAAQGSQPAR